MKHSELMKVLTGVGLGLRKSRLEVLSMVMLALVEARTVNLTRVAVVIQSLAQPKSVYRRLQRFFAEISVNERLFTRLMVSLLRQKRYTLCLDRTHWTFGQLDINVLVIAVANDGLAVPIAFRLLNKAGNSNTGERTQLLNQVLEVIEAQDIEVLLADREFIGQTWFGFLLDRKVPFAIRIRQNCLADEWFRLAHFFTHLKIASSKCLRHRYVVCGHRLNVVATRAQNKQLVIIVSNRNPNRALNAYRDRWQIESLFKALKSSGFNLEDTHLRHPHRLTTLLAIVSLAFLWAIQVGHWCHQRQPIPRKAHGRREQSVFRLGLDFIHRAITNLALDKRPLQVACGILSCT